MKGRPSLTLLFLVVSPLLFGQEFWNLDFEYSVYHAQPRKWSIEGEGDSYSARLDTTVSHRGQKSLQVTMNDAQVFTFLRIPRGLVAGRLIQFIVYAKGSDNKSLQVMLAFRDPGGGRPNVSAPQQPDQNWKEQAHETVIPAAYSSDFLLVAIIATGKGTLWLDNIRIVIDGKEEGVGAPDFREPTRMELDALKQNLIPLAGFEAIGKAEAVFGDAKVVGLGENSHGSASIYRTKLQVLKFLVQRRGFNVFALESPAVEADAINEYVLGSTTSSDEILKNLVYPSWKTREMLDIIDWIREYNRSASSKVQFRGLDMQDGSPAIAAMEKMAAGNSPALLGIGTIKQLWVAGVSGEMTWPEVYGKAVAVDLSINLNDQSSNRNFHRYHRILMQAIALKGMSDGKTRDDYLAENVAELARERNKVVVSADNTHVTRASGKMGRRLADAFGPDYIAVGMTFATGTYWAYGPGKYYEVHPPSVGAYENLFARAGGADFILDLRKISGIELLDRPGGFRSIGSMPQETTQFADINLKDHFDVIIYLQESKHSVVLTDK